MLLKEKVYKSYHCFNVLILIVLFRSYKSIIFLVEEHHSLHTF